MFKLRDIVFIGLFIYIVSLLPDGLSKGPAYASNISKDGLDFIKKHEGFSSVPYRCPNGVLTIGYGSTYIGNRRVVTTDQVTEQEAEKIMVNHIQNNCSVINEKINKPLTKNQYDSLCSVIYRVGVGRFMSSHIVDYMNDGDLDSAVKKLNDFAYIKRGSQYIPLPGLIQRTKEEQELLASV